MKAAHFCVFETSIGVCGIAWSERGIAGVRLPDRDAASQRRHLRQRFTEAEEAAPTPQIQSAIGDMIALLNGAPRDLSDIALDMEEVGPFEQRVYTIARAIPPGRTLTYGAVAERLGDETLARAVGQALGSNPFPIIVPCHRVIAAGGKLGGFSAPGGGGTKRKMLAIENAKASSEPDLFDPPART